MYSLGAPQIDDDGVQIQLFKDGRALVTGVALHNGKGPEETTLRAAHDARRALKQIRRAFACANRKGGPEGGRQRQGETC